MASYLESLINGNLTKLNRNGSWVVFNQKCSNGYSWLHK